MVFHIQVKIYCSKIRRQTIQFILKTLGHEQLNQRQVGEMRPLVTD